MGKEKWAKQRKEIAARQRKVESTANHHEQSSIPLLQTLGNGTIPEREAACIALTHHFIKTNARITESQRNDILSLLKSGLLKRLLPLTVDLNQALRFHACSALRNIADLGMNVVLLDIQKQDVWTWLAKSIQISTQDLTEQGRNEIFAKHTIETILEIMNSMMDVGINSLRRPEILESISLFLLKETPLEFYQRAIPIFLAATERGIDRTLAARLLTQGGPMMLHFQDLAMSKNFSDASSPPLPPRLNLEIQANMVLINLIISSNHQPREVRLQALQPLFQSLLVLIMRVFSLDTVSSSTLEAVIQYVRAKNIAQERETEEHEKSLDRLQEDGGNDTHMNQEEEGEKSMPPPSFSLQQELIKQGITTDHVQNLEKWFDSVLAQRRAADILQNIAIDSSMIARDDDDDDFEKKVASSSSSSSEKKKNSHSTDECESLFAELLECLISENGLFLRIFELVSVLKSETNLTGSTRAELICLQCSLLEALDSCIVRTTKNNNKAKELFLQEIFKISAISFTSNVNARLNKLNTEYDDRLLSVCLSLMWGISRKIQVLFEINDFLIFLSKAQEIDLSEDAGLNFVGFLSSLGLRNMNSNKDVGYSPQVNELITNNLVTLLIKGKDSMEESVLVEIGNALIDLYSNDDHNEEMKNLGVLQSLQMLLSYKRRKDLSKDFGTLLENIKAFLEYKQG